MNETHLSVVGIGPGDPDLITVKGLHAIEAAGVLFAPRSQASGESLALMTARRWMHPDRQRIVELPLAMSRGGDVAARAAWQAAADTIAAELAVAPGYAGAFLMLGDPSLYGTFSYIGRELAERHPTVAVEVVPGVTSFAAAAARMKTSLGLGDERVAIVPATTEMSAGEWRELFERHGTVVLMKVGSVLPRMLEMLEAFGLLDAALYAERVGMEGERLVYDVRTLVRKPTTYFSLMIVRRGERHE